MSDLPSRPRLAAHVVARRHLVDGGERIVLHDLDAGRLMQVGPREWGLLAAADGTRDLEGVVLAAAREGAHARVPALRAYLEQLHGLGMIEDGIEPPPAPALPAVDEDPEGGAARPLALLPGFSLHCDGSGSCCRLYASVIFGPVEAARARALLPLVQGGGARHERVFMPEHGSGPTGGSAVTLRDGRCVYLGDAGRCALHAAGGAGAKPLGCATFPATFVDDGEGVRVSVSVECACVLASVGRPGGAPLVPPGARVRGDLDETLVVERLADHVPLTAHATAPRAAFVAWSRRVAAAWPAEDAAAALWALSGAVERAGLDGEATAAALTSARPPPVDDLRPWIEALHRRAAHRAREDATWRSEVDLARRAARWIAEATARLLDGEGGAVAAPGSERFYVEALLHGHRLAEGRPLSAALCDRAVRVVVARALPGVMGGDADPAGAHPLALVEAMLRGHGLAAYADDLERGDVGG